MRMTASDAGAGAERELASLVHDLRTPLAIVIGFAELLEAPGAELTEAQRADYARRIADAARELSAILDRGEQSPPR